ncbi:hypothetical protein TSUD_134790 [Trifolium subterraneum]|uniref:Uncharacterized protein n=1 Tax=Trifolium subterraneum TaxID=3900 RepID=A0A2Z6P1F0_TRISU|nr:hypothetical protein TSUD_134790 [Trifolium subterraneum]
MYQSRYSRRRNDALSRPNQNRRSIYVDAWHATREMVDEQVDGWKRGFVSRPRKDPQVDGRTRFDEVGDVQDTTLDMQAQRWWHHNNYKGWN